MLEGLKCWKCGFADTLKLRFADEFVECSKCNNEITVEQLKKLIDDWQEVVDWIEHAPYIEA
jgi:hypothetical protein